MRSIVAIGLIGGLLYWGSRAFSAKRLSDKSVVRTLNPRIAKITLAGVTLATDIYVDNPTNGSVQITKPVITISTAGKYVASSVPTRDQYTIAPLKQTSLGVAQVEIPWSALTPYISNLVSRIPALVRGGNTSIQSLNLPLEYRYSVYVNDIFYESNPERLV
ncbi:hypothetical protein [Croceimicrobium sp.]|uniref:hypothetical protein n=1 Tax=Croceimicrobium sp. TaxID=2828340 RepID=UPI003BAA12CB